MMDIYRDRPDLYDLLHADETADLAFYAAVAGANVPSDGTVLELGCGTGRVMQALLDRGLAVTGLDAEEAMLSRAGDRLGRYGPRARLVLGDMRQLDLGPERFDLVLVAANTFMHLDDHQAQQACLSGIATHLAANGLAVLDLANPFHLIALPQGALTLRKLVRDDATGAEVSVTGTIDVDATAPHAVDRLFFDRWDGAGDLQRMSAVVRLRLVFMPELELLLAASGLGIADAYGDYDLGPYHAGAERMIVMVRRYDE